MSDQSTLAEYTARYVDGESAKPYDVILSAKVTMLVLTDRETGEELASWPLYRIRLRPRVDKNAPFVLGLLDNVHNDEAFTDARITLSDSKTEGWIKSICPELERKRALSWRTAKPYVLWSGAATASVVFLFWIGVPLLASVLVRTLPDDVQVAIGRSVEEQVVRIFTFGNDDQDKVVCRDPAGKRALDKILAGLEAENHTSIPISLSVLNTEQVNALALPGGRILIFKGLIDFVDHPNGLAGVIAHELGHIAAKDPLQGALEQSTSGILIGLLLGDVAGGAVIATAAEATANAAYTREKEATADQFATNAMVRAGWDVAPFARFFDELKKKHPEPDGVFAILNTHPPSEERRATIAQAQNNGGGDALNSQEWDAVQAMCD